MNKLQYVKENEVEREIALNEGGSFAVTYYGASGPLHDTKNLRYIRFDDKHVLCQSYQDTARELIGRYSRYLTGVRADQLAFMVDEAWVPSEKASKNSAWKIDIQKAPYWLRMAFGFDYMVKLRLHWLDQWSDAQLHAAIMSQLLRVNPTDGSVLRYSEDLNSKLIATFGSGYLEPHTVIADLLKEDVSLREFRRADGQVTIEEIQDQAEAPESTAAGMTNCCGVCAQWDRVSNGMGSCLADYDTGMVADSHPACDGFESMDEEPDIEQDEEPAEDDGAVGGNVCGECASWCDTAVAGMGSCGARVEQDGIADSHPACGEFYPRYPLSEIPSSVEGGDDHGDAA